MKAIVPILAAIALAGCASGPVQVPRHLFADASYAAAPRPPTDADIFALSDAMRQYADTHILERPDFRGRHVRLASVLKKELRLEYDARSTLPAADTFELRAGNCMSLVILTAALAKHLDVPLTYQLVYGHDAWSRTDGIAFLS